MKKEIVELVKKDKRLSIEGEFVIRKEYSIKYVYKYDKNGNLLEKTADSIKYVYKYDKNGNLLEKTADGREVIGIWM